jgi:outer membrane protein assembly factor BamA
MKFVSFEKHLVSCLLLLVGLFAMTPKSADAQTNDKQVTAIVISGLKRTQRRVVEQPLQKFIGRDEGDVNLDEVYTIVMDTGILDPLSVTIEDAPDGDGKALTISVQEKWAFFPIPLISIGSEGSSFGGAIMDLNAFGLNDKMIVTGAYSTSAWMAGLIYSNTPDRAGLLGWNVAGFYTAQEREDMDQKKNVYRRFNTNSVSASIGLSYPVTEWLTANLSFSYQNNMLGDTGEPVRAPTEGAQTIGIAPSVSVRQSAWDGYFLSEQQVSITYTYRLGIESPSVHSVSLRGTYEKSLLPGFRLNAKTGVVFAPSATVFFESSPSSASVDILPGKFSAKNYAGASLGFEKYLLKFSFGTISALAAYQVAWSEGAVLGHQFDHGVAGAMRLYLSKLAIPAIGVGASYNVSAQLFQFTFSMGMSI